MDRATRRNVNKALEGVNNEHIKYSNLQPIALSAKCGSDITYRDTPPDVPCKWVQGNCGLHNNQCVIIDMRCMLGKHD